MKFPLRLLAALAGCFLGISASFSLAQASIPGPGNNANAASDSSSTVVIPGPLRSFLRMSGISQEVRPDEVLPMLARNVFLHGYEEGRPTEFLRLIERYLHQARELSAISGNQGRIYVANCADAQQLIRILGYRFEHGCSRKTASLTTEDADRAFLTVDSGFPLTELEEALERGTPFSYSYPGTRVPVVLSADDWMKLSASHPQPTDNLVDVLLHDLPVDRLYSAMDRIEPHTRLMLSRSPGLRRLLPVADAFDFYGSQLCIPNRAVIVPGGLPAEANWTELVGANPASPGEFVLRLLGRDRGWLAAYFDVLSRLGPEQQARLVQGPLLKNLYEAYRSTGFRTIAASGVFPRNATLLLLLSRLHWQANELEIPGSLPVWQEIFAREFHDAGSREWVGRMATMNTQDRFLMALAASANLNSDASPALTYLAIGAIDERRPADRRLKPDTVSLLAARFTDYHDWYRIFSDFPEIDDRSIAKFIQTADQVNGISSSALRANALGSFQSDIGIWQILARQHQIPVNLIDASFNQALAPFASVTDSIELFEATRHSLNAIVTAAGGSANPSEDQIVDLLAGPVQNSPEGQRVHAQIADHMQSVLADQRLASLDTIFGLYDGLDAMAHGAAEGPALISLAKNLHQFEMPRPIFTGGERVAWSPMIYTSRHAELQVQTDLTRLLQSQDSPGQLEAARAYLSPFLRDTLVGLNYAYYEPPGAQVLHNNPLFVRSHDFSVTSVQGIENVWGAPELIGVGATAGGGAYLMGSLAGLSYALATTEEDFIAPRNVQALIWRETVPNLMVDAVIPRWWNIGKNEMHAAALYQRSGEELLRAASTDAALREKVMLVLRTRFTVAHLEKIYEDYAHPGANTALANMLPSDTFYLAVEFRRRFPAQAAEWSPAAKELDVLAATDSSAVDPARIARDFGVPHPTITESDDCSLLAREAFPVADGYASQLFAESWESSNLYWARIADEMGYAPVMLNILAPELAQRMIANIFATYVDDWPALLRAMQETGTEFRQGKLSLQQAAASGGPEQTRWGGSE